MPNNAHSRKSAHFTPNQSIFITGWPNIRKTPGYVSQPSDDVIGMAIPGTPATVTNGPQTQDNLLWWQVESSLEDGTPVQGWVAQVDPKGTVLLSADNADIAVPNEPTTSPYIGKVYAAGTQIFNCCGEPINIRKSAGTSGKGADDRLVMVPAGAALMVEGGPREVDDLVWWMVSCQDAGGLSVIGWVAEATSEGVRLISTSLPGPGGHTGGGPVPQIKTSSGDSVTSGIHLEKPFEGNFAVSQWWGGNPEFYKQFSYDHAPLRGHNGLDFATWVGTPLIAVDDGQIIKVDYEEGGFGHHILIRHGWGESLYAHLEQVGALHGASVTRGQQIGLTGDSGAGAAHLHFGIRLNPYRRADGWGGFTDPRPLMNPADLVRSRSAYAPVPMAKEIPGRPRP